jgi:hypothetical protein
MGSCIGHGRHRDDDSGRHAPGAGDPYAGAGSGTLARAGRRHAVVRSRRRRGRGSCAPAALQSASACSAWRSVSGSRGAGADDRRALAAGLHAPEQRRRPEFERLRLQRQQGLHRRVFRASQPLRRRTRHPRLCARWQRPGPQREWLHLQLQQRLRSCVRRLDVHLRRCPWTRHGASVVPGAGDRPRPGPRRVPLRRQQRLHHDVFGPRSGLGVRAKELRCRRLDAAAVAPGPA